MRAHLHIEPPSLRVVVEVRGRRGVRTLWNVYDDADSATRATATLRELFGVTVVRMRAIPPDEAPGGATRIRTTEARSLGD